MEILYNYANFGAYAKPGKKYHFERGKISVKYRHKPCVCFPNLTLSLIFKDKI